jgi:hypothetical protein
MEPKSYDTDKPTAVWNFDQERLRDLNERLIECEDYLENWEVYGVITKLYSIRRILWGAIDDKEGISDQFKELENLKREYDSNRSKQLLIKLYNKCDHIFLKLTEIRSEIGIEFRKNVQDFDGL